jgi:hypothetical protein
VLALGGCGLLGDRPREGAVDDLDAVVEQVEQVDGVAAVQLVDTDDPTSGSYLSGSVEVDAGHDPVAVLDDVLAELYRFDADGPRTVLVAAVQDGVRFTLDGPLAEGERTPYVRAAEMERRYGAG